MVSRFFCLILVMHALSAGLRAKGLDEATSDPATMETVVVVANRTARPLYEVAAHVTVINAEDLESAMIEELDGLFRYSPGVEMERGGTRFGSTSANIRGIGGNRVAIEVDGVPVRDHFDIGAYSNAGRALVETDRVKRTEILYGPASAMYGSDALGGVIAITTWDPADLLKQSDGLTYHSARGGWQGQDQSFFASALGAWAAEDHSLLIAVTGREGHELERSASTVRDPQDWNSLDAILRYRFDTPRGDVFRTTISGYERSTESEVNSLLGYGRRFKNTTSLEASDDDKSGHFSMDYEFSSENGLHGRAAVYRAHSRTRQVTYETRVAATPAVDIRREFSYKQNRIGVTLDLFHEWTTSNSLHRLGFGVQWLSTDTEESRDGLLTNLASGEVSRSILGETLPVRDFPNSNSDEIGFFIQDEISFGRWELIPALRWDRYSLDPESDAVFAEDNPGFKAASLDDARLTPRLGVVLHIVDNWTTYAQYSEGFRAPPFDDVNIGFNIPLFGYRALPNPDLESETSTGMEWGIRKFSSTSQWTLALFHTDFEDFIESRALVGIDPQTGELLFQSRNIDRATIRGAHFSWQQELSAWRDSLNDWKLTMGGFLADGKNRESNQPLNSIAPPQAVTELAWQPDENWTLAVRSTFTMAKSEKDIDATDGERFATSGWGTTDITASWSPNDNIQFRAGVFNISDRAYWRWLDVAQMDVGNPMIPLLSRPGRSVSLSVRMTF